MGSPTLPKKPIAARDSQRWLPPTDTPFSLPPGKE
jgi:hypothetical protein